MTEWKKNQDNIEIQVEYEVEADTGSALGIFDQPAEIYFFYTHPDENRDNSITDCNGCNSNVEFPILEIDIPLPGEGEDGNGTGSNSNDTPGFTTALVLTSMMAAAVLIPKKKEEKQ